MEKNGVILMQRYELGRMLGQGSFAKVYHARSLATGQSVAVKIIDKEKVMRVGMIDQIKREISVMRLVRHPNVVQLHEVMASKSKIYFVMEYVKGGELFDKIAKGRLKEGVTRRYFQQLVGAVDFCHSRGVYHRDLKPENLLLDENGNLKITDFGLSALKESQGRDGLLHTTCGTPAYVAPEIINERGYEGAKADIWSCGVVLFVLLAGYLPFDDPNLMQMYRKVTKADFKCPSWFSSDVRRLLHRILDPNPATRITIEKLVQSHWFKKGYEPTAPYAHHQLHPDSSGTDLISDVNLEFMADDDDDDDDDDDEGVQNQEEEQKMKPTSLNAFDIISLSPGFDLSGLFENATCTQNRESLFMSQKPAADILSKFEEIAETEHFRVNRKDGLVKLQGNKEGRKGQLAIDAEIFEVTPSFYVVEVKKAAGDTLEYQNFCNDNLKPSLKDIAWSWQRSDQLPPLPPLPRSQI